MMQDKIKKQFQMYAVVKNGRFVRNVGDHDLLSRQVLLADTKHHTVVLPGEKLAKVKVTIETI